MKCCKEITFLHDVYEQKTRAREEKEYKVNTNHRQGNSQLEETQDKKTKSKSLSLSLLNETGNMIFLQIAIDSFMFVLIKKMKR